MAVVPGRVFHPDSQGMLDKAEKSRRTRECVQHSISRAGGARYRPRGLSTSTPDFMVSKEGDRV